MSPFDHIARNQVSRRDFLLSVGTATAATGALCGSTAHATEEHEGASENTFDKQSDVLVVGMGPGGLIAATRAAEQGVSVIGIDASSRSGGTMLVSNGFMSTHGSNSVEELSANAPYTDPDLGQAFLNAWDGFIAWCDEIGAPMSVFDRKTDNGTYSVYRFGNELPPAGTLEYADYLEAYAKDHGAEFIYETTAKRLMTDSNGRVIGVEAKSKDGSKVTFGAKEVILACGGVQRNREISVRSIAPYADLAVVRGNPHDTGSGMTMAKEVGAGLSRGFGTYYGHPVPFGINLEIDCETWDANIGSADWIAKTKEIYNISQNCGEEYGVVLNMSGNRFFDESKDYQLLNQELCRQPFARGFTILDASIRAEHTNSSSDGTDVLEYFKNHGGTLFESDTLEGLADLLSEQGVPRANVIRTLQEYNEAVATGKVGELSIPKASEKYALEIKEPPFVALPIVTSIIFPYGGVRVDGAGHVLDIDNDPIDGLWATQGVAGGLQYDYFIGILCSIAGLAFATGTEAGKAAQQA